MRDADDGVHASPFDPSFWTDPYRFYPDLLAGPPRRLPLFVPTVVVTRYRDVVDVLGDPGRFSSCVPPLPFIPKLDPFGGAATMLFSDAPTHTRLKRLASRYFRTRTIEDLGPRVRATTDDLVARIAAKGEFDAVLDLGAPLPVAINAHLLGIRIEDQPMLKAWEDEIFASVRNGLAIAGALFDGEKGAAAASHAEAEPNCAALRVVDSIPESNADAMQALREYFIGEIERRQADPGDDLISAMTSALHSGDISRDELVALALLLLFAGSETTTNLIANGLLAMVNHRREHERLKSAPELIVCAIEEILRYDSPVQMVMRFSTSDTYVGGTHIPPGAVVLVMLGAANRDPAQFRDPDRFDVGRRPNEHVAFGEGVHSCIGSQLARLEGRVAIGAMLERFPALRLRDVGAPLQYSGSLLSRGLRTLPMVTG